MNIKLGEKYLITTDCWFIAPDGQNYKAVYGTVNSVNDDSQTLGIKTNARSTNWYVSIGNMLVAGCQIHYAIKTDQVSRHAHIRDVEFNGKVQHESECTSRIYDADE